MGVPYLFREHYDCSFFLFKLLYKLLIDYSLSWLMTSVSDSKDLANLNWGSHIK